MSETWNIETLPEGHIFVKNTELVACTEGTWSRTKQDGTKELAPKWDYVTKPDQDGMSMTIGVFSSTDKEELKIGTAYDLILKEARGKDGKFYGHSLKGFAPTGEAITKKEPQSRWQKGQKLNTKVEALKAATNCGVSNPDVIIEIAEVFDAWLNDAYKPVDGKEIKPKDKK